MVLVVAHIRPLLAVVALHTPPVLVVAVALPVFVSTQWAVVVARK